MLNSEEWAALSEAYAFLGNSLLLPMNQTAHVGVDPGFWEAFPDFGDADVRAAADDLCAWARRASAQGEEAAVEEAAVEHTHLFVGPPKPAAAPWETFHRGSSEVSVGFGVATYEMRALLREAGLGLSGPSNQYEDHMGVELLLLAELCRRAAEADEVRADAASDAAAEEAVDAEGAEAEVEVAASAEGEDLVALEARVATYLDEHPLEWVGRLSEAVEVEAPDGYVAGLLRLERALLVWTRAQL